MNNEFTYSINNIYIRDNKIDTLINIINSISNLQQISNNIFKKINDNIIIRQNKLNNLNLRIIRINKIIQIINSRKEILTIKSSKNFPLKKIPLEYNSYLNEKNNNINNNLYKNDFQLTFSNNKAVKDS